MLTNEGSVRKKVKMNICLGSCIVDRPRQKKDIPKKEILISSLIAAYTISGAITLSHAAFAQGNETSMANQTASDQTMTNQSGADVVEELQPIQDHIDQVREALRNNDTAKALGELNSIVSELLKMTQGLTLSDDDHD